MRFITSPTQIFGLDISDTSLKAVELKYGQSISFRSYAIAELPPGLISEGIIQNFEKTAQIIRQVLNSAHQKFSTKYVVIALPETKTFIKVIEIPKKKNNLTETLKQELSKHVPVDLEEMQIDWQEIKNDNPQRKFLIGMAPKNITADYTRLAHLSGLEPVALEIESQAISRSIFAANLHPQTHWWQKTTPINPSHAASNHPSSPKIIFDLGALRSSLILIDHNTIQFTTNLTDISGQKITAAIADKKKLDLAQAEKTKILCGANPQKCKGVVMDIITTVLQQLSEETHNAENFYQTHFNSNARDLQIVLCGGGASLRNIDKTLAKIVSYPVQIANPLININHSPLTPLEALRYTTAIGLALRNIII